MNWWISMSRVAVLAAGIAAAAAPEAPAQSAPTATPATAERFKDWELFCPQPKPKDKPRICEVRTIIIGKEGARLGALAIALNPEPGAKELPMIATALLPLGVDLTRAPTLRVGEGTPLPLQFRRCLQRGCEAVALIDTEHLTVLRAGTIAKVAVGIGGGKVAVFEFSLAGFTAAHDTMKQRAGKS
ncbi:MAG: invasion associated locus B family protein [Dongiaceae bacterium]